VRWLLSGQLGLGTMNGDPMLLDVGVHFLNEPSFQFDRFCRVDDPRITVGPVNILTVPRGMIVHL
jgi:hypothetical protein